VNKRSDRWGGSWRRLRQALAGAEVDSAALDRAVKSAIKSQSIPVLWLLGTTQSGKTSIVRVLTGSQEADIGNGFQPCTRTARMYDFPGDAPVVRFLDTRGLGEVDYDPTEDLAQCEHHSHLVIAVVRACDARPVALQKVLGDIRSRHPDWPVVIAQTTLHQAYPDDASHVQPYPFDQEDWQNSAPDDLTRLLIAQRAFLGDALTGSGSLKWVPIDFTLPEDGFTPTDYGIDALWSAIEETTSLDLEARLRTDPSVNDIYAQAAHPQIVGYSIAAATAGALPLVDLALVPGVQARMLYTLGKLYERPWDRRRGSEFLALLGSGIAGSYGLLMAGRSMIKLIPVWGQTIGAAWGAASSGALTYALGKTAGYYLYRSRSGHPVEAQALRDFHASALERGRSLIRSKSEDKSS
jgi:uncharacterized protein (DUF697 family)